MNKFCQTLGKAAAYMKKAQGIPDIGDIPGPTAIIGNANRLRQNSINYPPTRQSPLQYLSTQRGDAMTGGLGASMPQPPQPPQQPQTPQLPAPNLTPEQQQQIMRMFRQMPRPFGGNLR